jgi:hypothetical protein
MIDYNLRNKPIAFLMCLLMSSYVHADPGINWPQFLGRHDLKWTTVSDNWYSGAFIGNGQLGAMIYKENDHALRWDIGRSDVTDHRDDIDVEWGKARLPIGKLLMKVQGSIITATMKLDLWNAEATGTITTDKGTINWRSFVASDPDVIVTDVQESGSEKIQIEFVSEVAQSPRLFWEPKPNFYTPWFKSEYLPNPTPLRETINSVETHQQPLLVGGGFTTSWKAIASTLGKGKTIFISVGYSQQNNAHRAEALKRIIDAEQKGLVSLTKQHRDWWHTYYPQSFLSVPDTRMESFYWIQQYKLAAATRSDKQVLDLMGPWYYRTPWPALWWNLNIQLNYLPVYTSNRLSLGESLCNSLDQNVQNFIDNVPEKYRHNSAGISRVSGYDGIAPLDLENDTLHQRFKEAGNLTWILHNYWMQCKYGGDEARMVSKVYPLLVRSINFLIYLLHTNASGVLHMKPTYSPEYTPRTYPDCNYTLSLLRWGTETLLDLDARYKLNDTLAPKWRDVLQKLTDYPQDSITGFHIGLNEPLRESHRHYAHLMMIYPLRIFKPDTDAKRSLIEKSLAHWTGLKGGMQGYTFTGAASMSALLGKGDDAYNYLNDFIDQYVQPNTFYREAGPVIETPLSAVASINEMLLQSFNDEIHVFPAVPAKWKDACFEDLRAEGAFLVKAKRAGYKTAYVGIKSLKGGSFKLKIGSALERYIIKKSPGSTVHFNNGFWEISLKKGAVLQFYSQTLSKDAGISPVEMEKARLNSFGSAKTQSK